MKIGWLSFWWWSAKPNSWIFVLINDDTKYVQLLQYKGHKRGLSPWHRAMRTWWKELCVERGEGNMWEVFVLAADGGDDQAKDTDAQSESWSETWGLSTPEYWVLSTEYHWDQSVTKDKRM